MHKLMVVLALVACSKQEESKPESTGRPAVITQAMADTFEAYITAFEKLVTAIDAAHGDCKAAVAAIDSSRKDVAALADKGAALREAMKSAKADPAAGQWFGKTYGPRMQAATGKLRTGGEACEADPAFRAGLNAAMADYPMMRRSD
jgi:hypothetical protein